MATKLKKLLSDGPLGFYVMLLAFMCYGLLGAFWIMKPKNEVHNVLLNWTVIDVLPNI